MRESGRWHPTIFPKSFCSCCVSGLFLRLVHFRCSHGIMSTLQCSSFPHFSLQSSGKLHYLGYSRCNIPFNSSTVTKAGSTLGHNNTPRTLAVLPLTSGASYFLRFESHFRFSTTHYRSSTTSTHSCCCCFCCMCWKLANDNRRRHQIHQTIH